MHDFRIVNVDQGNVSEFGFGCVVNPKYEGYQPKLNWLKQRFSEGLQIRILRDGERTIGFIEYIPGEYAWRAVDAKGYMFVHCIWLYPKKNREKGSGSLLLQECLLDKQYSQKRSPMM